MNIADAYDVDVCFYHRDATIYVETRTGASERLLALLDGLGLDRHRAVDDTWHQVPDSMDEIAMKTMADRAESLLTEAGYAVDIGPGLSGGTAYRAALAAPAAGRKLPAPVPRPASPRRMR